MLEFIRKFFDALFRVHQFITKKYCGKYSVFMLILSFVLIFACFGQLLYEKYQSEIILKVCGVLYINTICFLIPYLFFVEGDFKKYIIFGEKEKYIKLLNQFNFRSYIIFICKFSFLLYFPLIGLAMTLNVCNISFIYEKIMLNTDIVMYICSTIISILWFSYHIINSDVSLQLIRVAVNRYIAFGSTLILIFDLIKFEELTLNVSFLLVSYFWIQYLIELRECEINKVQINVSANSDIIT